MLKFHKIKLYWMELMDFYVLKWLVGSLWNLFARIIRSHWEKLGKSSMLDITVLKNIVIVHSFAVSSVFLRWKLWTALSFTCKLKRIEEFFKVSISHILSLRMLVKCQYLFLKGWWYISSKKKESRKFENRTFVFWFKLGEFSEPLACWYALWIHGKRSEEVTI